MYSTSVLVAAACGLLASSVNAHMMMNTPVPYGKDSLNNSPLEPDGSDFPCKQRSGVYDVSQMNNIPVGVPQQLKFTGGATHGGGSCQLSVTMDKNPTKSSKWKVVHSILGGCPNGASGNAGGDPTSQDNPTFEWSMPKNVPNGEYTLAWTWFNKIGNREMYMNCAPITVTGGSDGEDGLDSLPDMFVANVPTTECETTEGEDLIFPNPGQYVETAGSALGSKLVGACTAGGAGSGGGSGAAPTGYGGGSSPSSAAAQPTDYGGSGSGAASSAAGAAPTGYDDGSYKPEGGSGGSGSAPSISIPGPKGYTGAPADSAPSATQDAGSGGDSVQTATNVVVVTTMATVTADGPAPTGFSSGSETSGSTGEESSGDESSSSSNGTSSGSGSCASGSVACSGQDSFVCNGDGNFGICDSGCALMQKLTTGDSCGNYARAKRSASHLAHLKRRMGHHAQRRSF